MVIPTEQEHPQKAFGWAARDSSGVLSPFNFSRRYIAISSSLNCQIAAPVFVFVLFSLTEVIWLQGNRRERRDVQSVILWDLPFGPSHGQERMGILYLSSGSRVRTTSFQEHALV
jgi:hypothetical protein